MRRKILSSQLTDRIVAMANTTLDAESRTMFCIKASVGLLRHGAILPPRCEYLIFSMSPEDSISSPESLTNVLIMGFAFIGKHWFPEYIIQWFIDLSDNNG
jgi:hypothetical protein